MASFKDPKRRMAILIADLYYESEQHRKALSIYQRLENRELGTLSKNELAYVVLATFNCFCWDSKIDEITYIFYKAKSFENTPSEARAYFHVGNRLGRIGGLEGYKLSIQALETCIQKYPDSKEADNARLFLAEKYKDLGNLLMKSNNLVDAKKCHSLAYKYYQYDRERHKEKNIVSQIDNVLNALERLLSK
jgi:tetratricopeptide (TPR) repeat protein